MNVPEIEELARRFTALELSRAAWTHEAHLLVGLWHVSRYGTNEALPRLRDGIRRLNVSNGIANTAAGGYHETITAAYVQLLAQFDAHWQSLRIQWRGERLLRHPLGARTALFTFYSRERLLSPAARAAWCDPDVVPLVLGHLEIHTQDVQA